MKSKINKVVSLIRSGKTVREACEAAGITMSAYYYQSRKIAGTLPVRTKKAKTAKTSKTPKLLSLATQDTNSKSRDQVFIFIGPASLAQETLSQYRSNSNG